MSPVLTRKFNFEKFLTSYVTSEHSINYFLLWKLCIIREQCTLWHQSVCGYVLKQLKHRKLCVVQLWSTLWRHFVFKLHKRTQLRFVLLYSLKTRWRYTVLYNWTMHAFLCFNCLICFSFQKYLNWICWLHISWVFNIWKWEAFWDILYNFLFLNQSINLGKYYDIVSAWGSLLPRDHFYDPCWHVLPILTCFTHPDFCSYGSTHTDSNLDGSASMGWNNYTNLLLKRGTIIIFDCLEALNSSTATVLYPGVFSTKVKHINSQSDLISTSSFAGPSYLTIRSSVCILKALGGGGPPCEVFGW